MPAVSLRTCVMATRVAIGFDFGTESVRVVVVTTADGRVLGQAAKLYAHGVIDRFLPTDAASALPADYALQHPQDWLDSAAAACGEAMRASGVQVEDVAGIGVDFTSCTVLPCWADGTPLCMTEQFARTPLAWPKLWKHHAAKEETAMINRIAAARREPWLDRYGGAIGLEWFFPKVLETLRRAPEVYAAADVWIEAGDWFVWQLTTGLFPASGLGGMVRSTCQAGYKAMWNKQTGYPSREFFGALHPAMSDVVAKKLYGSHKAPGELAGKLSASAAALLGLDAGTPVSAATIDAHAGVPGAGVGGADTMVLVMGTSSCHMINSAAERLAPGIAGVVDGGILAGYFGYETGQASVGDAFAWFVNTFKLSHQALNDQARLLPPGSNGVMALDWLNGCRTPLMDGRLSGAFIGVTLGTQPAQMYRALMEATAFGLRWIVETLRTAGVPVKQFVASGGLPAKSPLLMQIYADVLNAPIALPESDQSVALGAAIIGCVAAGREGGHDSMQAAIAAMARQRADLVYHPSPAAAAAYEKLYPLYRRLADGQGIVADIMRQL